MNRSIESLHGRAPFAVVRAPSGLGLRAAGVEGLPAALLDHGLAQALSARIAAAVPPQPASGIRDPASGVLNAREITAYAVALADALEPVVESGEVPLVLGGDCTVLLRAAFSHALERGLGDAARPPPASHWS